MPTATSDTARETRRTQGQPSNRKETATRINGGRSGGAINVVDLGTNPQRTIKQGVTVTEPEGMADTTVDAAAPLPDGRNETYRRVATRRANSRYQCCKPKERRSSAGGNSSSKYSPTASTNDILIRPRAQQQWVATRPGQQ